MMRVFFEANQKDFLGEVKTNPTGAFCCHSFRQQPSLPLGVATMVMMKLSRTQHITETKNFSHPHCTAY